MSDLKDKIKKAFARPAVFKFKFKDEVPGMVFKEDKNLGIIKWGINNRLPDFLVSLGQTRSATHAAILNRKTRMIAGSGFEQAESEEAKKFLANIRGSHSLDDMVLLNASDYEYLNHFAIMVRWNADKDYIGAVDFVPAGKVRIGTIKDTFLISDNWKAPKKPESNTKTVTAFSRNKPEGFNEMPEEIKKQHLNQLIFFKELQIGTDTYARPNYSAGMNWILSDAAISKFTLNMIKKNFAGGYHIHFSNGIPEEDERKDFKRDFNTQYGGEDGDSIVISWGEGPDEMPQFNALPSTGNEDIYNETEKRSSENIFKVHEVTNPALFGVRVPGELGGKSDLEESLDIFQAVYIDQRQESLEKVFNKLAKINGVKEELRLKKFKLTEVIEDADEAQAEGNKVAEAIGKLSPPVATKVLDNMDTKEIRSLIGLQTEEGFTPPSKVFSQEFKDELIKKIGEKNGNN
jgi:hypothetical protein